MIHEFGHTFADLADEYTTAYPGYPPGDGEPNVDYDSSGAALKWLAWVDAGLPVNRGQVKVISLERQVRIVAGSLVFIGVLLGWFVHPAFVWLSGFVGAGLVFAGVTDFCGMGLLLAKAPWNQRTASSSSPTQSAS